MSNLSQLCSELKAVLQDDKITLPNSAVTAVDVNDFLKDVLKTDSIDFSNASVTCDDSSVTITGDFTLFDVQLTVNWGFTAEDSGSITWKFGASTTDGSKVSALVDQFMSGETGIPTNVSALDVTGLSFESSINTGDSNYSLDLKATTSWGSLELFVQDNSGTWGTAIGIAVSSSISLSDIESGLSAFDALKFSDSAVVISTFEDDSLEIVGITGVIEGIEFRSTLTLDTNSGSDALSKITNELASSLSDIPLQIGIDLSKTKLKLSAAIDKSFPLPGYSTIVLSGITMSIDTTPSASLSGKLTLPITIPADPTVTSVDVTGAISFTYSAGTGTVQATLNSDTEINEPFGFYGVTLKDVGVGIDASFGVETGAGITLEGAFLLGSDSKLDEKFAITIEFTDDVPNPSLLYSETKNLSLPVIFDSVIKTGIKLPSVLSDFSFDQLMFYWCDKAQTLPDGTECQIGIGYNAAINFWGFNTYSALMINKDSGISGKASTNPISLANGDISLTGKGVAGLGVKAGGPYFDFDTTKESFDVSVDANVLGITEVVDASVSTSSLDINMSTDLGFLQDSLSVKFEDGGTNMSFSSSLEIGIDCSPTISIGGVDLGTIKIDEKLKGSIDVSFKDGTLSAKINASFDFDGTSIPLVDFNVGASLSDLSNLASVIGKAIEDEASSIFADFFKSVENYISVVGKGLISGGDFVVNVLYHVYSVSVADLFEELSKLPTSYHVDGKVDFPIKIAPGIPAEKFHADLGHLIDFHADKHADVLGVGPHFDEHADLSPGQSFSTPAFEVDLVDIDVNQHFDFTMPPTVHADASSPHLDTSPHLDASFIGGSLGVSGKTGIDSKVSLTDIELGAKLDVKADASASIGIHGDIAGIGIHVDQHGDKSAHIDEAV